LRSSTTGISATCAAAGSTRNIELNAAAAAGLDVTIHANAAAAAGLHVTIRADANAAAAGLRVTIHGNLGIAKVSARKGARPTLVQVFRADFGLDLPPGPRRTTSPHWAAIGLAPDSWLLTCEGSPYSLAPSLESSLGPAASITDQTDAYVVLTLTGAKLREILAKLTPIDLHPRSFQPGDAAQTLAAHISIILWRLDDVDGLAVFELAVPRSYFASLRESLYAAAAEFCNARAPITQHAAVNRTSEPLT